MCASKKPHVRTACRNKVGEPLVRHGSQVCPRFVQGDGQALLWLTAPVPLRGPDTGDTGTFSSAEA